MAAASAKNEYADRPLYWFALLQGALDKGDLQAAAAAQRRLSALGVEVSFPAIKAAGAKAVKHAS